MQTSTQCLDLPNTGLWVHLQQQAAYEAITLQYVRFVFLRPAAPCGDAIVIPMNTYQQAGRHIV
jgi:hypothetical protein